MQNKMRDRLVCLLTDDLPHCTNPMQITYDEIVERLADHLISSGVIVPPVKVGQTVYIIDECYDSEEAEPYALDVRVKAIGYDEKGFWIQIALPLGFKQSGYVSENSFGKTVFSTREEAEKTLAERLKPEPPKGE